MFPVISLFSHRFSSFYFMIAVAAILTASYALVQGRRRGLDGRHCLVLAIITILSGLVGMRLFHVLVEAPRYYVEHPTHIAQWSAGGFVSWGAVIGIGGSAWIYLKRMRLPVWRYLDALALAFPIVLFCVRIGCLGVGCCYGKPVDGFPLFVVFTDPRAVAARYYPGFPLHATQLYAMANAVMLFVLLHLVARKQRFEGELIAIFAIGYGFLRAFLEEPFRADIDRGVYLGFISTGQMMGIALAMWGVWLYRRRCR